MPELLKIFTLHYKVGSYRRYMRSEPITKVETKLVSIWSDCLSPNAGSDSVRSVLKNADKKRNMKIWKYTYKEKKKGSLHSVVVEAFDRADSLLTARAMKPFLNSSFYQEFLKIEAGMKQDWNNKLTDQKLTVPSSGVPLPKFLSWSDDAKDRDHITSFAQVAQDTDLNLSNAAIFCEYLRTQQMGTSMFFHLYLRTEIYKSELMERSSQHNVHVNLDQDIHDKCHQSLLYYLVESLKPSLKCVFLP